MGSTMKPRACLPAVSIVPAHVFREYGEGCPEMPNRLKNSARARDLLLWSSNVTFIRRAASGRSAGYTLTRHIIEQERPEMSISHTLVHVVETAVPPPFSGAGPELLTLGAGPGCNAAMCVLLPHSVQLTSSSQFLARCMALQHFLHT